ncbi:MAG: sugar phosphate isomerase/epimerase family protein [Ancrocorticia sp.]
MKPIVVSTSPTANRRVDPAPILLTGTLDSIIADAKAAGADGVELRLVEGERSQVPIIKQKIADAGLIIGGISTGRMAREGGHCLSSPDPTVRSKAAEALCILVDMAAELGTDILVGSAKGQQAQDEEVEAYTDRLADPLLVANNYSVGTGVRIHIEAINRFEINALTTGRETLDFITTYGLTNCFVHLDTFHTNIEEVDPVGAILECGDKLGYFQFADSNRRWPGAGHINFAPFEDALRAVNYAGPLSIECQPIPDGVTAARNGIAFLRSTIKL